MFNTLRPKFLEWRQGLDTMEEQLETKRQRLCYLQEAPLPAAELADMVIEIMTRRGDAEFHNHLDIALAPAITHPMRDAAETTWFPGLLGFFQTPDKVQASTLFYLLREPLAKALRRELVAWPDYPESGPPRAEREAEIPRLEKEIESLITKIEAERSAAEAAGLELAQVNRRDSIRKPSTKP